MAKLLDRGAILGASDLKFIEVKVPEWTNQESGANMVRVRSITGTDRDEFEAVLLVERAEGKTGPPRNVRARLVSIAVVDEAGNKIFTPEDIETLGQKSAKALDRVYAAAAKLNAFSQADIEELEKN